MTQNLGARNRASPARMRGRLAPVAGGLTLLAAAAAALWWLRGPGEAVRAPLLPGAARETPVVLYLIDTLRSDRVGLYGYDKPTTPVLDALAAESVVFEEAHAAAPWTLPSLASVVTSRYPCEHGLHKVGLALNDAVPTLAEKLQALGYATGSYYQNPIASEITGLARGYQTAESREEFGSLDADAREFLGRVRGQPFFLYLHSMEPHDIAKTPAKFIQRLGFVSVDEREEYRAHYDVYRNFWFIDAIGERAPGVTDTTEGIDLARGNLEALRDRANTLYDAAVAYADDELGQAIAELKAAGLWEQTLFIVLGDHGEEFGEHGLWFHDQSVYEELIRVPLLIHFPGGEFAGQRVAQRVSLLDVMPTILDALGQAQACEGCRGSSLLALLRDGAPAGYMPADVPGLRMNAWSYYRPLKQKKGDINVVVRDGRWKGIWNAEPDTVELYDLTADPGETRDLGGEQPERAAAMAARASEWLEACRADLAPPREVPREEIGDSLREQLRAHGYFGG